MSDSSPADFPTATDSPVRRASSEKKPAAFSTAQSAGIRSPASSSITSPVTSCEASISFSFPSLQHFAVGEVMERRASSVFSVRYSCTKPSMALRRTMRIIVTASDISPRSTDITVAPRSIITITSLNCPRNILMGPVLLLSPRVFSPCAFSLSAASFSVRPIFSPFRKLCP